MSSQVFFGRLIHSKSLEEIEIHKQAALGIDTNGIIAFLDPDVKNAEEACKKHSGFADAKCTTLEPLQFLFPGLIDSHLHAPQWPNLAIGMEGNLREWVETYTDPIEASYKDTDKARRVYDEMVQKELEMGSTTVAYNSSIQVEATNVLADTCLKYGQRAVIGKLCILTGSTHDNWDESPEQSLEDAQKCIDHIRKIDPEESLIMPCVKPRGGPYAPPKVMAGLGAISHEQKTRVQAHMCETTEDITRTLKLHTGFEHYTDMYKSYDMLHEGSILAHCIHLSDHDIEMLRDTKAGVAHNANSNTCLRDGECRVRQLLKAGVKVGLGTDCSAGYSTFMLDSIRQASNVSRHLAMHNDDDEWMLSFPELVYLATLGSASVLTINDKVGNFEVGKCFDALIVDTGLRDCINIAGWEDDDLALLKKWVFMGDDRSIQKVFVNGKLVTSKV
ncbi:hypothetical protein BDV96DRAFT_580381 [Lophiotrema nucula]|uniref:Amidohydrolase-related domain-containing protein n=1 Tax=Lophiotrema nucula TaxID=690887 RepID=A0A6A5YZH8_9PLEO|nr:hypothetical protein BDV96DRAFT_580381 [Lophiotrema nucula]